MNVSKQTFSSFFFTLSLAAAFLTSGVAFGQSSVLTSSVAPAILPLQVQTIEAAPLRAIPENRDSYVASYPGGQAQVATFLQANVAYPEIAQENNFEGTTIIRFKVLADGSIGEYIVQQSTHTICDQEVIDALKQMGQWNPAKIEGKTVASWRAVAVDFKLGL